jgi:hypothetical protein
MGKASVPLVYIVLVCRSANAAKQNMSWAEHSSLVGWRQLTLDVLGKLLVAVST